MLRGNLRWTNISFGGSKNTPSCFILQKPEISAFGSPNFDWGRLYPFFLPLCGTFQCSLLKTALFWYLYFLCKSTMVTNLKDASGTFVLNEINSMRVIILRTTSRKRQCHVDNKSRAIIVKLKLIEEATQVIHLLI